MLSFHFCDAVKTAAGHAAETKQFSSMKMHQQVPNEFQKWCSMSSEQLEAEELETKQQSFGQDFKDAGIQSEPVEPCFTHCILEV